MNELAQSPQDSHHSDSSSSGYSSIPGEDPTHDLEPGIRSTRKEGCLKTLFRYFDLAPDTVPVQTFPYMTVILSVGLILIYVIQVMVYDIDFWKGGFSSSDLKHMQALSYPEGVVKQLKLWQYATCVFLHSSASHVGGNVAVILYIGWYMEAKYHWHRIFTIFLLGGIAASFSYTAYRVLEFKDRQIYLLGASGGCYTLLGMLFSDAVLNWETVNHKILRGMFLLVILGMKISEEIMQPAGVATMAHMGGLLYGIGPALAYLPNFRYDKWETILIAFSILLNAVFFIACPIIIYF